ncbi:hypothetical protein HanPI659440_Chr15g0591001 [Helianthus annuus]|nr:hypothetical protein HanHA300_Chr15g0561381 [Helianthus annuus]KAJ0455230.1 hypothetical protein HanIR_Chr15g0748841 [Helianthus annuus]KAJ0472753.1 hypothetical protein HanHA89_Chr15g0610591 [Helianthus annuus]KAJ0648360.1 hypothetical protein HanLR1_Chr15g0572001 [Helianthus annuus]KAJ0692891.1 hypothetical protein HanPI659440_Chr15g0591001 [Helianthus annuus]
MFIVLGFVSDLRTGSISSSIADLWILFKARLAKLISSGDLSKSTATIDDISSIKTTPKL